MRTAVLRNHTERAWAISSRALRKGTTYADWKTGSIPVPPYPVSSARWKLAYSVAGEIGFDVLLEPSDTSVQSIVYRLTLVSTPTAKAKQWLVDTWSPLQNAGGFAAAAGGDAYVNAPRASVRSSGFWILIPFGLLGVGLLTGGVVALGGAVSRRRVRKP